MAATLIQSGNTITLATGTARTSGELVELVDMVGVVADTTTAAQKPVLIVEGVFAITKTAHAAGGFAQGDTVYVTATGLITNVLTSAQKVGTAWELTATDVLTVNVKLNWP